MSISVTEHKSQGFVEIAIQGSFDFSLFNDFRLAYGDLVDSKYNTFVINLDGVDYLDSAALGMLLSMRVALGEKMDIQIVGANDFIRNILMISRFDKRFNIL